MSILPEFGGAEIRRRRLSQDGTSAKGGRIFDPDPVRTHGSSCRLSDLYQSDFHCYTCRILCKTGVTLSVQSLGSSSFGSKHLSQIIGHLFRQATQFIKIDLSSNRRERLEDGGILEGAS